MVELPWGPTGVLIGGDLRDPGAWDELAAAGARVVLGGASEPAELWERTRPRGRRSGGAARDDGGGGEPGRAGRGLGRGTARRSRRAPTACSRSGRASAACEFASRTSREANSRGVRPMTDEVQGLGSVPHAYYAREQPLTGVVLFPSQADHDPGEHPENIRRLPGVVERLRDRARVGPPVRALPAPCARRGRAALARPGVRRALLESAAADAPVWLDTDTRVSEGSFRTSMLATGAALSAVDAVAMEAYHRPDSLFTSRARPATTPASTGRWASA